MPRLHRYRTTSRLRRFAGASSLFAGLVAWWKLDEASGTRADELGNSPLAATGTVSSAAGIQGNAASFAAGANFLASSSSALALPSGSWTYAGWFNVTSVAGNNEILNDFTGAPNNRFTLQLETTSLRLYGSSDGTTLSAAAGAAGVSASTWTFFVAQFNAPGQLLGVSVNNGTLGTVALASVLPGIGSFRVGRRGDAGIDLAGSVDALGRWNRLLSAAEIAYLYNSGTGRFYPWPGGGP